MKLLTNSNTNPNQLFVAISEFEFNGFAVPIRRFDLRPCREPLRAFRMTRRTGQTLWTASPIPAAV